MQDDQRADGPRMRYRRLRTDYGKRSIPEDGLTRFQEWRGDGRLGFMDLPGDGRLYERSRELAAGLVSRRALSDIFVIGIGGSSLGLRALLSACLIETEHSPRVHFVDGPDEETLNSAISSADPSGSLLVVITRSGGTAETVACLMRMLEWLSCSVGDVAAAESVVAITMPGSGDLSRLADSRGWPVLPVPGNVGGRFSVLSPVGVFPALLAGLDCESLLDGAGSVVSDLDRLGRESLAMKLASACFSRFSTHRIHCFFAYCDRLFDSALWFSQLWAESLGKRHDLDGAEVMAGQTPLACRGPADQHSLLQLFMEGPADTFFSFLTVEGTEAQPLPSEGYEAYPSLSYLQGRTLDELRLAEASATASALSERGLPVVMLGMPDHSERSMGELFMLMELTTVLVGLSLNIDPLDQPGVERAKVLTYEAMGRPGYTSGPDSGP